MVSWLVPALERLAVLEISARYLPQEQRIEIAEGPQAGKAAGRS
jgi:hypothetical protein